MHISHSHIPSKIGINDLPLSVTIIISRIEKNFKYAHLGDTIKAPKRNPLF